MKVRKSCVHEVRVAVSLAMHLAGNVNYVTSFLEIAGRKAPGPSPAERGARKS